MWRVVKWLLTTLWALSSTFAAFVFYQWLQGKAGEIHNLPRFISFLLGNKLVLVFTLLVLGLLALISFQRDARQELEKKVWFYKSTSRLKPSDVNPSKAWYDSYFVERPAVARAVKMLASEQGLMLIGVPLLGKTRCAYEVLKKLQNHSVLGIKPQNQDIAEITIPRNYLLFKPKLVVFLDDLQLYLEKLNPAHLSQYLLKQTSSFAVLATCRSGEELDVVENDKTFGSFIKQDLQKVYPDELTKAEEQVLAKHFRREWNETAFNGTPGSIVFDLEEMRRRLGNSGLVSKTLMRSMYLMGKAGIDTYRKVFVEKVAKTIYELKTDRLGFEEAWHWLEAAGFLAAIQKIATVPTHRVYLETSFCSDYGVGDTKRDLASLWQLVIATGNAQEIFNITMRRIIEQKFDDKAEEGLRAYLKLEPDNPNANYFLGAVLRKLKRPEGAEKAFRKVIRLDPNNAEGRHGLGMLLRDQKKYEAAEKELREAVRLEPTDGERYLDLGILYHDAGRYEDAIKEFRKGVSLNPNAGHFHFHLGASLYYLDLNDEAEKEYREAIRLDPDQGPFHFVLGELLEKRGKLQDAAKEYREAIRCDSADDSARKNLSSVMQRLGRIGG